MHIVSILDGQRMACLDYHEGNASKCHSVMENYEEAELNFFIKYGELGAEADVRDAYMKQKHRLIWERQNQPIMEARRKKYEEHKKLLSEGVFDISFWKSHIPATNKETTFAPYFDNLDFLPAMRVMRPLSKDWRYYKKAAEDEMPDPEGGHQTSRFYPWQIHS